MSDRTHGAAARRRGLRAGAAPGWTRSVAFQVRPTTAFAEHTARAMTSIVARTRDVAA
ncbi:MAG: hypothetical protein JWM26_1443 [Betaproteobacteria bacterium]|nr:hypothetical protein [Betaproteobacteria bacterium]